MIKKNIFELFKKLVHKNVKKMDEGVKKITYFGFFVTYFAIIFNINMTYFGPKSNIEIRALIITLAVNRVLGST